ncbi:MAG: hypothetical protein U0798_13795 [Gemmataceae bacterium]
MNPNETSEIRRTAYWLMGTIAVMICVAKTVGVESVFEPSRYYPPAGSYGSDRPDDWKPVETRVWPKSRPEPAPTYGSNDRSRWATIRALVDNGTYVIGKRSDPKSKTPKPEDDTGIIFLSDYLSVDKVMNPETGEFFSSKPPLMPTLIAGEYWLLKKLFGWSIDLDRWLVIPFIVLTVNIIPFAIYLWLLARLIEQYGKTDFGKLFTFAAGSFATYLVTFSATLNNHSPATVCALFAIYPLMRARPAGTAETPTDLFLAGFFAAFTACFDLPAACFTVGLCIPVLIARPKNALTYMLPGLAIPVVAFFASNYAALGRLTPAYSEFGGPWYEYAGSNWNKLKLAQAGEKIKGIDFAMESRGVYLFHMLLGHHGWFSLSPYWLIGLFGMGVSVSPAIKDLRRITPQSNPNEAVWTLPLLNGLTFLSTFTLVVFFVWIQKTNNYGGQTSGLRWFFWLTPLWLLTLLTGLDRFFTSRRWQILAFVLLGLGVLSVFYPAWNPWRHPWILNLCERTGWVRYG